MKMINRNSSIDIFTNSIQKLTGYQNFSNIHDTSIEGEGLFSVPYNWINQTILVEVIANSQGKEFKYYSQNVLVTYMSLFSGILVLLLYYFAWPAEFNI